MRNRRDRIDSKRYSTRNLSLKNLLDVQDEKKDSVLVEFASDGTQMWWGALYLQAGGKQDL